MTQVLLLFNDLLQKLMYSTEPSDLSACISMQNAELA
jgi:hypothetical protein